MSWHSYHRTELGVLVLLSTHITGCSSTPPRVHHSPLYCCKYSHLFFALQHRATVSTVTSTSKQYLRSFSPASESCAVTANVKSVAQGSDVHGMKHASTFVFNSLISKEKDHTLVQNHCTAQIQIVALLLAPPTLHVVPSHCRELFVRVKRYKDVDHVCLYTPKIKKFG